MRSGWRRSEETVVNNEDHLSNSVSVEAALTDTGIKASAKSRFVAAVDRLLAGVFDLPAAHLEARAQLRRLETEISLARRKSLAEIDLRGLEEIKKLETKADIISRSKQSHILLNKQGVILEAIEDLKSDPMPTDTDGAIDDDWLNLFDKYVEQSSSERLQNLWGRILAGEIRRPGSFSLTTLRVLSELDQSTASRFLSFVPRIYGTTFVVLDQNTQGQFLIDVVTMEELGFLQYGGGLRIPFKFDQDGKASIVFQDTILLAEGPQNGEVKLKVAKLTRTGAELLQILPRDNGETVARLIAGYAVSVAYKIEIGQVISRSEHGTVNYRLPLERIK